MIGTTAALIAAGIGAAGAVGSAAIGSHAAGKATDTQAQAAQAALDFQKQQWQTSQAQQAPWLAAGQAGLSALSYGLGLNPASVPGQPQFNAAGQNTGVGQGEFMQGFHYNDLYADPGYQFRLAEGQKALERSASARGNLLSGGALKSLTRYSQGVASDEFNNAFNRYNIEQANRYNRLAGMAGVGQQQAQQLAAQGQNYANAAGDYTTQAANARASGYVGAANQWSGALNNAGNNFMNAIMLNQILGQSGGVPQAPYVPAYSPPDLFAGVNYDTLFG